MFLEKIPTHPQNAQSQIGNNKQVKVNKKKWEKVGIFFFSIKKQVSSQKIHSSNKSKLLKLIKLKLIM